MGDDGSGDLFALGLNPCRQVVSLLEGHQGIDQDGVLITEINVVVHAGLLAGWTSSISVRRRPGCTRY
jgi:hypothetical protein